MCDLGLIDRLVVLSHEAVVDFNKQETLDWYLGMQIFVFEVYFVV